MKYTHQQYVQALYESLNDTADVSQSKIINNFINILRKNGDLSHYPQIVSAFEHYINKQTGVKSVEVTTASEFEINNLLISNLNSLIGDNPQIKYTVDKEIIGGVIVKVDETLIDGSVKSKLSKIRKLMVG